MTSIRELSDWEDSARKAADERCGKDEHHCACVPVLRADLVYTKSALKSACAEVARLRGLVSEMVDLADRDTTSIWELGDSIAGVLRSMRREVRK